MKYLLAVDGGGTKTEFCVSDLQGNVIKSFFVGSSNYKSIGELTATDNLKEGINQILEYFAIELNEIVYSVWGISGCDSENDFRIVNAIIKKIGIDEEKMYLCNDGVLAFYAQTHEPGIVIIAGTGSIVIGIDKDGIVKRCGGWGYNISDIGSGYWIGNEAIKQTLLYCDGCLEYSPLYEEVRTFFKATSFEQLPYIVTEVTDNYEIAKVAYLIVKLSEQKIDSASEILHKGAAMLAIMVSQVYKKLNFTTSMKLNFVFSGGVLKSKTYQQILSHEIEKLIALDNVKFSMQENAPAYGGIKLAKKSISRGEESAK